MGFEIDFLAVGDGEKSGDAIALRDEIAARVGNADGGTTTVGSGMIETAPMAVKCRPQIAAVSSSAP